jgi:hypothetical protein
MPAPAATPVSISPPLIVTVIAVRFITPISLPLISSIAFLVPLSAASTLSVPVPLSVPISVSISVPVSVSISLSVAVSISWSLSIYPFISLDVGTPLLHPENKQPRNLVNLKAPLLYFRV